MKHFGLPIQTTTNKQTHTVPAVLAAPVMLLMVAVRRQRPQQAGHRDMQRPGAVVIGGREGSWVGGWVRVRVGRWVGRWVVVDMLVRWVGGGAAATHTCLFDSLTG